MSELMDRGIIGMPFEMAMADELSRRQLYARAQAILAQRDQLRAEVEALRDAAMFASVVMGTVAMNSSLTEVERRSLLLEVRRCDAAMAAKEG